MVKAGAKVAGTGVTVSVSDGFNPPITQTFQVTVIAPTPPAWATITNNIVTPFNTPVTFDLQVTSVQTPISSLQFAAVIETNVVSSVVFTNTGTNVTATINLVTNAVGSEAVSLSMFDGYTNQVQQTTVTVLKPAGPAFSGTIAPVSLKAGAYISVGLPIAPGVIPLGALTVTAVAADPTVVTPTVTSDNTTLFLHGGAKGGVTGVTVTVSDGFNTPVTQTFQVTVQAPPPPAPPAFSGTIAPVSLKAGAYVSVGLPIAPGGIALGALTVTAVAADPTVVTPTVTSDNTTLFLHGGAKGGVTGVTVTVSDGINTPVTQTFQVTVLAPPPPPPPVWATITNNLVTAYNTPLTLDLQVTSAQTPISSLEFTAVIETNVVSSVVFTNTGTNVTATFQVVSNATGSELVTLSMNDGYTNQVQQFTFTVVPAGPPTLATIAPLQLTGGSEVSFGAPDHARLHPARLAHSHGGAR